MKPCLRCKGETSPKEAPTKNLFVYVPTESERTTLETSDGYDDRNAIVERARTWARANGFSYFIVRHETRWGHCKAKRVDRPCYACDGRGTFPALDVQAILTAITIKGKFRKAWPSSVDRSTVAGARAYFVWRLARFHGGRDVTLPMTAETMTASDPYKRDLDRLAELVAKRAFGTDRAGAMRWGQALGYLNASSVPQGMPESAYEGGWVADEFKLADESAELE